MAEAYLNAAAKGRFVAYSAGSHPGGKVNPFALELLHKNRIDTAGLRSKSWDEYAKPGAPELDFVFTVCDNAAGEACPIFPGRPVSAHWGIPDPAAVEGSDKDKRAAFAAALGVLRRRIQHLTSLPLESYDRAAFGKQLRAIGAEN